jgi:hypothetical protein
VNNGVHPEERPERTDRLLSAGRPPGRIDMTFLGRSKTKKHGMLMDLPVDDDSRCKECDGACCRAFVSVKLSWPEYERLRDIGAHRLNFSLSGRHTLDIENGCEFLMEGRCAIYDIRPETCRRFFCRDD